MSLCGMFSFEREIGEVEHVNDEKYYGAVWRLPLLLTLSPRSELLLPLLRKVNEHG